MATNGRSGARTRTRPSRPRRTTPTTSSAPSAPGAATAPEGVGPDGALAPAYYAVRPGRWRDWWTLLHPPYTAWHLSYVVIGAVLAPVVLVSRLVATLLAFFLAVGLAAHALDELRGRPLRTSIPSPVLVATAAVGLAGAVALGVAGVIVVGWALVPFLVVGPVVVLAYNLELFGGALHNDLTFATAWGGFPVLTAYVAETGVARDGAGVRRARREPALARPATPQHSGSPAPSTRDKTSGGR